MCNQLKLNSSIDFMDNDFTILYVSKFDEYGLKIFDRGNSYIHIGFCPWCGTKLPDSKREAWFDEIEKIGIDPWNDTITKKYQSEKWYIEKNDLNIG